MLFILIFPNNPHFIYALLQKQGQPHEIYARYLHISHEIFPAVQNGMNVVQKVPNFEFFVKKNISWNTPQILRKKSRNTGQGQ